MTKTDHDFKITSTVGKKTVSKSYPMIAGYIQVKPFVDQYVAKRPGTKTKKIGQWDDNNKKYKEARYNNPDP
jgi:hypothetical protein